MNRFAGPAFARGRTPVFAVWALALLLAWGLPAPAHADFDAGVRAYDAGDYEAAFQAWLPLARDGDSFAQRNLGHLYRLGRGVPQDFAVAANWYRRAAEQGLVRAQANLADMYLRGQGVEQDSERAAAWFHRAAVAGHTISQFNIGIAFDKGFGVPRDRAKAMGWMLAAAEGGHPKAMEMLEAFRKDGVKPAAPDVLRNEPALADAVSAPPGPVAALPRGDDAEDGDAAPARPAAPAARPAPRAATPPAAGRAAPGRDAPPPGEDAADEEDDPFASTTPPAAPVPRSGAAATPAPAPRPSTAAPTPARPPAARAAAPGAEEDDDPFGARESDSATGADGVVAGAAPAAPEGRDSLGTDDLGADTEQASPPPPAAAAAPARPATPAPVAPNAGPGAVAALPPATPAAPAQTLAPAEQQRAVDLGLEAYRSRDYAGAMRLWKPLAELGNRDAQFYVGGLYMDGSGVPADVVQAHAWWRLSADKGHGKAKEFVDLIESIMTPEERTKARELAASLRQTAAR